jgi:hypothetical protein
MKRLSIFLIVILAVQVALLTQVFWPREQHSDDLSQTALQVLDSAEVNKLLITDDSTSVVLVREDSHWILPEYHGLPVDGTALQRALVDLPELLRGWPVAHTSGAQQRFEVAEDHFQRRVQFFGGEQPLADIFLGTSPGFRKVHVRPADQDNIYSVEFNTFDLPTTPAQWLDKSLLQITGITAVQGIDFDVSLRDEQWLTNDGQVPDQAAVDTLINSLGSLLVTEATGLATAKVLEDVAAPPTLTINADGDTIEFRLFEIEEARYIKRNDIAVYFSLSALDYDRLNDVRAATLFPVPEQAIEAEATEDADLTVAPAIPADSAEATSAEAIPGEAP